MRVEKNKAFAYRFYRTFTQQCKLFFALLNWFKQVYRLLFNQFLPSSVRKESNVITGCLSAKGKI